VAVTYFTAGALTGPTTTLLGAVGAGAASAAAGSIVSQVVGVATGIQDKFSFKQVALAAISGAVGGGFSKLLPAGAIGGSKLITDVVRGALSNAATQGIAVATGLQKKFSWTGVAVGGVVSGVGGAVARGLDSSKGFLGIKASSGSFGNDLVSGIASGIAGAGARSLLTGTSFGDNLIAVLPDVIGSTIGRSLGGKIVGSITDTRINKLAGKRPDALAGAGAATDEAVRGLVAGGASNREIRRYLANADNQSAINTRQGEIDADGTIVVTADLGQRSGYQSQYAVYRPDEDRFEVSLIQRGSNPRARMGGNGGPPMIELRELRQIYGPVTNTPAGPIIGLIDNVFDISGPARRLTTDLYYAERGRLEDEIRSINPNARFDRLEPAGGYSRQGQIADIQDLLFTRAATYYNFRNDDSLLKVETLRQYQGFVDQGYREALAAEASGQLKIPNGWSREIALGAYTDSYARYETKALFNRYGVSFGPRQGVSVNNRDYAPDNSYRIPDVRIGSFILDGTLSAKGYSAPQIKGYFQSQPGGTVANVRPAAKGPTYFLKAPK
jgi:hypothetical protein